MNWEAIGAVGETLGALAVVLTLAYLARQMRQETIASTSNAMGTWLADYNSLILELIRDPEVALVVRKGLADFEHLEGNDQMRFHVWMVAHLLNTQNLYLDATMHGAIVDQVLHFLATMLSTDGGMQWWITARPIWTADFVAYMDKLIEDSPAVTETWPFFAASSAS
jgi:hypothetical protein